MEMQEVFSLYEGNLRRVEQYLESQQHSYIQLIPEIANHIINSGGKRLRPLLLLIASDLCGYKGERCYSLAAVMEFIHTASLLHDDVIDRADKRRGRDVANRVWGNSASVLVGDYLYAKAFKMLADDEDPAVQKLLSTITTTMVEGEISQLVKTRSIDTTEKEYLSVIEKKTAVLISASCAVGALLAKAPESDIEALARFGMRLGMAFQLTDDALDYVASEEEFGKTIGKDLKEGKVTLPLVGVYKKSSQSERELIKKTVEGEEVLETDIAEIVAIINKYGGIEHTLNVA
ncbi:MAG: polyprenyl synthetase family protein, partial [Syntrophobacterales bacterium]